MRKVILATVLAAALGTAPADAALIVFSGVGGAPTAAGVVRDNLDWLLAGSTGGASPQGSGITVSFTPNAQAVTGSSSGVYAAPFLSGGNGTGFGAANGPNAAPSGNQANGQDATRYVTTGSTGAFTDARVEFQLPGLQQYFGLLWGSVDLYNTLSFYNGNTLVGAITGASVNPGAAGDQGPSGTYYVNINSTLAFDRVVATSSNYAFELDNVAFASRQIPEPATLVLLGLGLMGAGARVRRRR